MFHTKDKHKVVSPLSNTDETGNDDSWGDCSQDKSEHQTNSEREAHDKVTETSHCSSLNKTWYECSSENHATEVPQRHGVHLQPSSDEDDSEAQCPQLPGYHGVQLVTNILGMTVSIIIVSVVSDSLMTSTSLNSLVRVLDYRVDLH